MSFPIITQAILSIKNNISLGSLGEISVNNQNKTVVYIVIPPVFLQPPQTQDQQLAPGQALTIPDIAAQIGRLLQSQVREMVLGYKYKENQIALYPHTEIDAEALKNQIIIGIADLEQQCEVSKKIARINTIKIKEHTENLQVVMEVQQNDMEAMQQYWSSLQGIVAPQQDNNRLYFTVSNALEVSILSRRIREIIDAQIVFCGVDTNISNNNNDIPQDTRSGVKRKKQDDTDLTNITTKRKKNNSKTRIINASSSTLIVVEPANEKKPKMGRIGIKKEISGNLLYFWRGLCVLVRDTTRRYYVQDEQLKWRTDTPALKVLLRKVSEVRRYRQYVAADSTDYTNFAISIKTEWKNFLGLNQVDSIFIDKYLALTCLNATIMYFFENGITLKDNKIYFKHDLVNEYQQKFINKIKTEKNYFLDCEDHEDNTISFKLTDEYFSSSRLALANLILSSSNKNNPTHMSAVSKENVNDKEMITSDKLGIDDDSSCFYEDESLLNSFNPEGMIFYNPEADSIPVNNLLTPQLENEMAMSEDVRLSPREKFNRSPFSSRSNYGYMNFSSTSTTAFSQSTILPTEQLEEEEHTHTSTSPPVSGSDIPKDDTVDFPNSGGQQNITSSSIRGMNKR